MVLEPIFLYCERTGPGLWGEPLNLMASVLLAVVAVAVWRGAAGLAVLQVMAAGILLLALSSAALHMVPSRLTLTMTLAGVLLLQLGYFYAVFRDVVGMSHWLTVLCTLVILPLATVSLPLVAVVKGAGSSLAYAALPVLLLGCAAFLGGDHPRTARGLTQGAAIFVLGLVARSLDVPLCDRLPVGTHFLWILCIAWLLWHLARVYRAHMLAARAAGR